MCVSICDYVHMSMYVQMYKVHSCKCMHVYRYLRVGREYSGTFMCVSICDYVHRSMYVPKPWGVQGYKIHACMCMYIYMYVYI